MVTKNMIVGIEERNLPDYSHCNESQRITILESYLLHKTIYNDAYSWYINVPIPNSEIYLVSSESLKNFFILWNNEIHNINERLHNHPDEETVGQLIIRPSDNIDTYDLIIQTIYEGDDSERVLVLTKGSAESTELFRLFSHLPVYNCMCDYAWKN